MRSAPPTAIPLARSAGAPAAATAEGREVAFASFALGAVLPLLGGGNVLLHLEPATAMPVLLIACAAFSALLLLRPGAGTQGPSTIEVAALLALLVWWLGNLALRPSGPRAVVDAQALAAAALLFLVLARQGLSERGLEQFVAGLGAGALVTALYGQYQYWIMFPAIAPTMRELYGQDPFQSVNANFYSANCYAPFLAATILLLGGLAWRGRRFPVLATPALLATLFFSRSRATVALLALAATLAAGSRLEPGRRRLALAILGIGVPAALWVGSRWIALEELWETALLGRVAIWRAAGAMIADHWPLGLGLGGFAERFEAYRVGDLYTRYAHNLLLEVFADLGIVGVASLSAFLVAAFAAAGRAAARSGSVLRHAALAAAALLFVHALVDIDWRAPANPILLMTLLAAARPPAPENAC